MPDPPRIYLPGDPSSTRSSARSAQRVHRDWSREHAPAPQTGPALLDPYSFQKIERHVRGRGEELTRALVQVAFLKSKGLVNDSLPVTCIGALYQRGKGSDFLVAAHQMPGQAMIGIFSPPQLCLGSPVLADLLKEPYRKTTLFPESANYGDSMFESSGGKRALALGVQEVILEQSKGKPVNVNLIRHVVLLSVLPKCLAAYEIGAQRIQRLSDKEFVRFQKEFWKARGDVEAVEWMEAWERAAAITWEDQQEEDLSYKRADGKLYLEQCAAVAQVTEPRETLKENVVQHTEQLAAAQGEIEFGFGQRSFVGYGERAGLSPRSHRPSPERTKAAQ